MTTDIARTPAGQPAGGEFATTARTEAAVRLDGLDQAGTLTALAEKLELTSEDLAERVRDITDQIASDLVNADTSRRSTADVFDERHSELDQVASSVNNSGVPAQVAFLVEHLGAQEARSQIEEDGGITGQS